MTITIQGNYFHYFPGDVSTFVLVIIAMMKQNEQKQVVEERATFRNYSSSTLNYDLSIFLTSTFSEAMF